jgi:hypothetical protein
VVLDADERTGGVPRFPADFRGAAGFLDALGVAVAVALFAVAPAATDFFFVVETAARTREAAFLTVLPTERAALRAFGLRVSTVFPILRAAALVDLPARRPVVVATRCAVFFAEAAFFEAVLVVFFELLFAGADRDWGLVRAVRAAAPAPAAFLLFPFEVVDRAFDFVFPFFVAIRVLSSASRPQRGDRLRYVHCVARTAPRSSERSLHKARSSSEAPFSHRREVRSGVPV